MADVLGRPIEYARGADLGSALGVAWVAGVAAGRLGLGAASGAAPMRRDRASSGGGAHRALRADSTGAYRELGGAR